MQGSDDDLSLYMHRRKTNNNHLIFGCSSHSVLNDATYHPNLMILVVYFRRQNCQMNEILVIRFFVVHLGRSALERQS